MTTLGQPGPEQYGYLAGYQGQTVEVWAKGQWPATQLARAHFKPPKSKAHLVWVKVAERPDGTTIIHTPVD